jgi:hypothetical protein
MSKRVYKFLSAQNGVRNLKNRRLKLSTVDDLNDPFDLCSVDMTDDRIEFALTQTIASFRGNTGLLCFSRNWDNLLLWSHYGESHKGICLGFDIPQTESREGYDMEVNYQTNLLKVDRPEDVNLDFMNKVLRTKHECWSYEEELRIFVGLNDPPDESGLWWFEFGPDLDLKEVIIGALCPPDTNKTIEDVVAEHHEDVSCSWAYMRRDAFSLVLHDFAPPWFQVKIT